MHQYGTTSEHLGQIALTARRHAGNLGFACRAAVTSTGQLVGFGYRGKLWPEPIEPWPEQIARERWKARFRALGGRI